MKETLALNLKNSDKFCDETSKHVLYASHRSLPNSDWPKLMLKRQVWRDAMRKRHENLGSMVKSLVFKTVQDATGKDAVCVDWANWGLFKLLPKVGLPKTSIQHVSGLAAELGDDKIDTDKYDIVKNWSLKCELHFKKWKIPVLECFSAADQNSLKLLDDAMKEDISKLARDAEQRRLMEEAHDSSDAGSGAELPRTKLAQTRALQAATVEEATEPPAPPAKKKRTIVGST